MDKNKIRREKNNAKRRKKGKKKTETPKREEQRKPPERKRRGRETRGRPSSQPLHPSPRGGRAGGRAEAITLTLEMVLRNPRSPEGHDGGGGGGGTPLGIGLRNARRKWAFLLRTPIAGRGQGPCANGADGGWGN